MAAYFRRSLILLLVLLYTCTVQAAAPPIQANSAILMDSKTGQVIYEKKMSQQYAPASTTKIMTALIAIEKGNLDDIVKVSVKAASTPGSSMHLYAGQPIVLRELLTGLLLRSGNDAAVAIAEHIAGSVEEFVSLMNRRAQELGAYNTHFRNPHGLSAAGHYSSAFDLAWIARYALTNPVFAEIVGTRETAIEWLDSRGKGRDVNLRNTNKLLWMFDDADGVKTGTTGEAGPCLVSSATRGNQKFIAVVLHDHSRWFDSMQLLKYGFDNFDLYTVAEEGEVFASLGVDQGLASEVDVLVASPAALVVPTADYANVHIEVDLLEKITAPVYKGQKLGEIIFFIRDTAVKSVDLIAAQEIGQSTPTRAMAEHLTQFLRLLAGWGLL